jgi:serine/threonine-protein kinase
VTPGDEVAGRYRLEELHGRGPMSEVWRAHDETLDRTVALKLLGPTADLERFRREARAVASLGHENVMRVYDYGEDTAAGPFMALEWLPGGTLEDRLAQGALPAPEVERVSHGIAAGLAHLHARDFVHRDLKPANVLFDDEERPKLADFGLARSSGAGTLTEAGTVLGTAAYISPEQAGGEPATPASDVYSFGVLLFLMLTGVLPFTSDDALALVNMHRNEIAPPVEALNPDAPPELAALANAALRKDPAERPQDGAALLAALGAIPAGAAFAADTDQTRVLATAAAAPTRPARTFGPGIAGIAIALLLLAALGGVLAWAVTRAPATAPGGIVSTDSHGHGHTISTGSTGNSTTAGTTRHHRTTSNTTTRRTTTHSRTTTSLPTTTRPPPPTTQPPPTTTQPPPTTTTPPPTTTAPPPTTTTGVTTSLTT